jgi:tetratricopeptide (TPR) repeat protein
MKGDGMASAVFAPGTLSREGQPMLREAGSALLPNPWLSVDPLYPGGFFPPLRPLATPEPDDALGARLREAAEARLRMDWPAARVAAEHAAALAMEGGQPECEACAQLERAATELLAGEVDAAERLYRVMDDGPPARRRRAALGLAVCTGVRGGFAEALEAISTVMKGAEPDDADLALLLANRAAALVALGRLRQAEADGAEALRAGRRGKDDPLTAVGGFALAMAHLARGRRADARTRLADSVRGFARAGDVLRQVQCHHLLGEISYDGEDPIRAGAHYRDALGLARPAGAVHTVELLTLRFEHR